MKFGRYLLQNQIPEWSFYYLSYNSLKKVIGKGTTTEQIRQSEKEFMDDLEEQLAKINSFYSLKSGELLAALKRIMAKLKIDDASERVERELDMVNKIFIQLHNYQRLNYIGFKKLLKKHDKLTGVGARTWFMIRLEDQPFYTNDLDNILLELSNSWKLFNKVRGKDQPNPGGALAEDERDTASSFNFVRKTTKYWVPEDKVMEVKMAILKHLPVSTFTNRSDSLITSVYYDNLELELYHERLRKDEGSINVRMRTYGKGPHKIVYVERKTHHDSWVGESSVKQRFAIKEKNLYPFLRGNYTIHEDLDKALQRKQVSQKEADESRSLSVEVQNTVLEKKLIPTVTTRYTRTAFQFPKNNSVRISLDSKLHMILEQNVAFKDNRWGRPLESEISLQDNEVVWFPFAVLETKLNLALGTAEAQWVTDLKSSGMLIECGKFSKFMHGCCVLIPQSIKILPGWLSLLEAATQQKIPTTNEPVKKKKREESPGTSPSFPSISSPSSVSPSIIEIRTHTPSTEVELAPVKKRGGKKEEKQGLLSHDSLAMNIQERPSSQMPSPSKRSSELPSKPMSWKDRVVSWLPEFLRPEKEPKLTPSRVEPKTFFANERTLLQWLSFLTLILSTGLILIRLSPNWQGFRSVGMAFTAISLVFMLYALLMYNYRRKGIQARKKGPYDDRFGPFILVTLLMITMGVVIYATIATHTCKGSTLLSQSFFLRVLKGMAWDSSRNSMAVVGQNSLTWIDPNSKKISSQVVPGLLTGVGFREDRTHIYYIARSNNPAILEWNTEAQTILRYFPIVFPGVSKTASLDAMTFVPTDDSYVIWVAGGDDNIYVYSIPFDSYNTTVVPLVLQLTPLPGLSGYTSLFYSEGKVYAVADGWLLALNLDGSLYKHYPIGLANPVSAGMVPNKGKMDVLISDRDLIDVWKFSFKPQVGVLTGNCNSNNYQQFTPSKV